MSKALGLDKVSESVLRSLPGREWIFYKIK
jgi:hypothetical protein